MLYETNERLKPDSFFVISYNWKDRLDVTTKQITLWGNFLYSVIDDDNNSLALYIHEFEDKYSDY